MTSKQARQTKKERKIKVDWNTRRYKLLEHFYLTSKKYGSYLYSYINATDAHLTVCPECHVDDFCHIEGCKTANVRLKNIKLISAYEE